jgi:hypothetical protein
VLQLVVNKGRKKRLGLELRALLLVVRPHSVFHLPRCVGVLNPRCHPLLICWVWRGFTAGATSGLISHKCDELHASGRTCAASRRQPGHHAQTVPNEHDGA